LGGGGGRARDLPDRRDFRRLSGEPQVSHFLLLLGMALGKNFRILIKLKFNQRYVIAISNRK